VGQAERPGAARDQGRRGFLRGAVATGLAAAILATSGREAEARHATGPGDLAAATVPPWPEPYLGQLSITWRVATGRRAVAISFDDGPDPRWTPAVLDALAHAGARATFFCCGQAARRHPGLVRRAAAAGEIGNHSWSHPDLAALSSLQVDREIDRTHDLLGGILGRPPTLLRPPYGTTRGPVLTAAARHGYRIVLWSDMVQRAAHRADQDVARLLATAAPGQVLLAHDGRGDRLGTLQRLPLLLAGLTAAGYTLTTVGELLASG